MNAYKPFLLIMAMVIRRLTDREMMFIELQRELPGDYRSMLEGLYRKISPHDPALAQRIQEDISNAEVASKARPHEQENGKTVYLVWL
jgi:hypothetical protein